MSQKQMKMNSGDTLILIHLKQEEDKRKQKKNKNLKVLLGSQVIRFWADSMEDVLQR